MRPDPLRAALLVTPLVLLVLAAAVAPLGALLWRGVAETEVAPALPRTLRMLRHWDGKGLPDDMAFEALAADLAALRAAGGTGSQAMARAAGRLGADVPALREVLPGTAGRAAETRTTRATSILVADAAWGEAESWAALRRAGGAASGFHLLAAIGLRQTAGGGLEDSAAGPHARALLLRGIGAALLAVLASLPLAWPLARWMADAAPRRAALLAGLVLLPLLAGEAARAAGWSVLAGSGPGVALAALVLGAVPLMALPVALCLRRAGPGLARAAAAHGMSPLGVFRRVHWPLARPGLAAGCALVFPQALGSFVGPGLLDPDMPWAAGALAAAARAGEWGQAGALTAWLLLPVLLAALLLLRLWRARA
ncbi:putative spermidine/putrescine transport system permease protein [Roseomonas rosea]|uniref:Putative spermidine/putrescine transport system permease protein n=1 Tax=Muricoccus roseus TaxID=198092 RepID=A0A1M6G743_9PROT|nr:ABC transporter permease subunit [Roseomonas rosea]SHJ05765.1 putative spermidine/putrescine transport system permease protein [Roseomonas rosea]